MSYSLAPIDIISMDEIQRPVTYDLHQVRQFLDENEMFAPVITRVCTCCRLTHNTIVCHAFDDRQCLSDACVYMCLTVIVIHLYV